MTSCVVDNRFGSAATDVKPSWERFAGNAYECRVLLIPEDEGGYSAHAMRLPGVVSEGETIEEALANVREAFVGAVRAYLDSGREIPWADADVEKSRNVEERWIVVNV
jgi:antitoxin HicB